ncbi:hypothetical protein HBI75_047700 [Parastagonospora nodorum]|nr:hypothetical protein HBI75_047700 [Parastagonospora nodorum]
MLVAQSIRMKMLHRTSYHPRRNVCFTAMYLRSLSPRLTSPAIYKMRHRRPFVVASHHRRCSLPTSFSHLQM